MSQKKTTEEKLDKRAEALRANLMRRKQVKKSKTERDTTSEEKKGDS